MFDRAKFEAFEILENEGQLTTRETHLVQLVRDARDDFYSLTERLARLEAAVQEARSQCRQERGIICKLYEIDVQEVRDE